MTLSLIGATGQLGGHAIDALLGRGTAPRDVLALGRNRRRLIELAERGLSVAELDLDDEVATAASLEGSDVLVLISVGGMSGGLAPRTAALRAAKAAGVGRVVYTSVLRASTTRLEIAADHRATEKAIEASGIPYTILRNGWYTENQRPEFGAARSGGAIANSIGQGRIASAPRREYGEAIAVTSTTAGHEGVVYELSGDTAWSFAEFAAASAEVLGASVRYETLTADQQHAALIATGLDEDTAWLFGRAYADMAAGELDAVSGDLARLIGHPTEPLRTTLQSWL